MAKHITYICDTCNKKEADIYDRWLTIGSETENNLRMVNNLPNRRHYKLASYPAIHFCSKECFVDYFFENSETDKS